MNVARAAHTENKNPHDGVLISDLASSRRLPLSLQKSFASIGSTIYTQNKAVGALIKLIRSRNNNGIELVRVFCLFFTSNVESDLRDRRSRNAFSCLFMLYFLEFGRPK